MMRLIKTDRVLVRGFSKASAACLLLCSAATLAAVQEPTVRKSADQTLRELGSKLTPGADEKQIEQRMKRAIASAAAYLVHAQTDDGSWRGALDEKQLDSGGLSRPGVTGLVTSALIRAHEIEARDDTRSAIERGIARLLASQDEVGCYGEREGWSYIPGHSYATLAMCEAQRRWPNDKQLASLKRSREFIMKARNPYKGWRYSYPPDGDNDSKVTGVMLLALQSMREAGLDVPQNAIRGGVLVLDEMQDDETGRIGFTRRGDPAPRFTHKLKKFPPTYSEEPTAIALCARLSLGGSPIRSEWMRTAIQLLLATPPAWDRHRGTLDFSYWYFGSRALAAIEGYQQKYWKENLIESLLPHIRRDEQGRGHWPAVDAWSDEGGEAYVTALNMLSLIECL